MLPNPKMRPTVYVPQGTPVNIMAKVVRAAEATAAAAEDVRSTLVATAEGAGVLPAAGRFVLA